DVQDIALLRKLNAVEPYSLLQCKKPWTLAVAQFNTPTVTEPGKSGTALGGGLFALGRKQEREDPAAYNGHTLAENLRKMKLEAYVLHTRYQSIVTVGSYDSLEDPNLRTMQNL